MIAYTYNPVTMEFVGESSVDESPLEPGVFLMPAYSTEVAPPNFNAEIHICYFDKESSTWKIQDVETAPEIQLISQEDVDMLKKGLESVIAEREKVLAKLGLSEEEIELLLVKLPEENIIDSMLNSPMPASGLPSLRKQ